MKDDYSKTVFQTNDLHELDKAINEQVNRKSLVKDIRGKRKSKKKHSDDLDFSKEITEYWYIYLFLAVSAVFTGTLGIYMGLSPYKDGYDLVFHTDFAHVALALVYAVSFVTITEGAFVIGKRRFYTRESENAVQRNTALTIMGIAGLSVFVTGIAGGQVVASQIDFLTYFVEIPAWAQRWVVMIIPALLTVYTFLLSAYHLSSDKAESLRVTNELRSEKELDSATRRNFVKMAAEESFEQAELKLFVDLVRKGKISRKQAMTAIENGWSLARLESFLNLDLDGDGSVGNSKQMQASFAQQVKSESLDNNSPN